MSDGALTGLIIGICITIFIIALSSVSYRRRINDLRDKYGDLPISELINIDKGADGERAVIKTLEKYLTNHKGYLINDVIIANLKGKTSQIDHILFTPYAIFVIETKNYSGYIYGKYDEEHWTQVMGYDTKNRLFNPIIQNRTHCSRISGILHEKYGVVSCVVFPQGNTENIKGCEGIVFTRYQLLKYLNKFDRVIYNDKKLEQMYNKINEYKIHPICSQAEHVNRVRREH